MNEMSVDVAIRKSKELRAASKYHEAIELLTMAIRHTSDARLYFSRGLIFDLMHQREQAVADITKAIELDPTNVNYYYNRGCILSHWLHRDEEAIDDFEKMLELESDNMEAHRESCLCLLVLGRLDEAWEHAIAAQRLAPGDALTHFCVGESQMSLKRFGDATESFTRAVELDPDTALYWAALARAHRNLGSRPELELAVQAYSRAIQLVPDSALYFQSRGALRLQLGMTDDAIADLRHALTLHPDDVTLMLINSFLADANKMSQ
jgi:tetratricopeptide (TPR) repeat protein